MVKDGRFIFSSLKLPVISRNNTIKIKLKYKIKENKTQIGRGKNIKLNSMWPYMIFYMKITCNNQSS